MIAVIEEELVVVSGSAEEMMSCIHGIISLFKYSTTT
jgi:hypothetical protein